MLSSYNLLGVESLHEHSIMKDSILLFSHYKTATDIFLHKNIDNPEFIAVITIIMTEKSYLMV